MHEAMQRPHILRACLLHHAEAGGDPASLVHGTGVTADAILALDLLSDSAAAKLFDHVARQTPPGFGLRWGLNARTEDYGPLGYLIQNCDNIRELNDAWLRYSRITGHPFNFSRQERANRWEFHLVPRYGLSSAASRMLIEMTLAGNARISRQLTGRSVTIVQYDFPFPEPAYRAEFDAMGEARLCFDAPSARFISPRDQLDWPIRAVDPAFSTVCESYCRQMLHLAQDLSPIEDRVMDALARIPGTTATLSKVAEALDMSERQLQRRLGGDGISFRDLRRRYMLRSARAALAEGESPKRVAHRVGLANASSLHRMLREHDNA